MPRVGGARDGGGEKDTPNNPIMTGSGTNSGYVVLGGTKYGIRLSQESLPPANAGESFLERHWKAGQLRRDNNSRERLTENSFRKATEKLTIDLASSVADCCCIGPRSKLPLPRISCSSSLSSGGGGGGTSSTSSSCGSIGNVGLDVKVGGQSPTKTESTRLPSNSNANNNCGGLQIRNYSSQPQSSSASSSTESSCNAVLTSTTTSFNPIGQSALSVPRHIAQLTKHQPIKLQQISTGVKIALQEPVITEVDRLHRFRWSGGGGGSGKKSSSGPRNEKAERLRELTEKLRSPAPVPPPRRPSRLHTSSPPPPPPNLPNQHHYHHHHQPQQQTQCTNQPGSRPTTRSYTYSEGSGIGAAGAGGGGNHGNSSNSNYYHHHPKPFVRSESVGEEYHVNQLVNNNNNNNNSNNSNDGKVNQFGSTSSSSSSSSRRTSKCSNDGAGDKTTANSEIDDVKKLSNNNTIYSEPKHFRQFSDSLVDSVKCKDVICDPTNTNILGGSSESEARDAVTRLEPRGPLLTFHRTGVPFRSASFSQVDFNQEKRIEPHEVIITPPPEEPRLSQASEVSETPSETPSSEPSTPSGKVRRYRGDTSKRRKGVYITQWPEPSESDRNKLSAQSSEEKDDPPATLSDVSDCEGHTPRRYSKRPLRGPYGQMLEAEMAKPRATDISLEEGLRPKRKISANLSYSPGTNSNSEPPTPCHHRTTSSPSKLEGLPGPSPELLAELLRGSSERAARTPHQNDTRTHVVVELYDTEKSYVEALQILVNKYLQTLKSSENAGLVDSATVDLIFYQVPAILSHHEIFLEELRRRLETWELRQTIGDVFLDVFTKPAVLETYTLFLDNWKSAKKAIKTTCQAKPAFARFLETMEREHKGKLGLDQLLIKPVQKIPRYELLIQRLLKHTDSTHPDYDLLIAAQKEVHELVVKINCTEKESLEWEQQQTTLKEVQSLVEGLAGIVTNDRAFVRHDLVTIASNQGTWKERALFLFSDLLVITSIKRRSGTIRKPSTTSCPNSLVGLLEANKYKLLMRIPLDELDVMKAKDENLRRMAREVDHLREDCATLTRLQELAATLHGAKHQLEDLIKELLSQTQRQLAERNAAHSQLACLELTLNTQSGIENISVMFAKPDKRASWEESFNEVKQKLALSADKKPCPEFVGPLPIRKTRAGLQFTCAAPTVSNGQGSRDVWVCNSDGYVGQVCVLSLSPEPAQVTSCNGVCNARILCVAGIPVAPSGSDLNTGINNAFAVSKSGISISVQDADTSSGNIQLDSSSSSDDSDSDDIPCADTAGGSLCGDLSSIDGTVDEDINQPTMWLGTEDGCIHVYNCNDNIRIKKNKVKIQHGSSVHSIIYLDNKVFVSLANGEIVVYTRDQCGWNTSDPSIISVGTPVTKMVPVSGKLWCSCQNTVKILNTLTLEIEHTLSVSGDNARPVSCMATSGGLGVWISLHNSAVLKLFHANTYECLTDINIAPAVTKMLASCDDIIRQHKAACLRVTALLACNDLLWIGTSAGVLLTVPIPHLKPSSQRLSQPPPVAGIPHGHTGHVRFLTCVETPCPSKPDPRPKINRYSLKSSKAPQNDINPTKLLVISGGDGYEDFRGPQASAELQAGREDSTNHLLLWKV